MRDAGFYGLTCVDRPGAKIFIPYDYVISLFEPGLFMRAFVRVLGGRIVLQQIPISINSHCSVSWKLADTGIYGRENYIFMNKNACCRV